MNGARLHVYFLKPSGLDGPIKIGCSMLPSRRLDEVSCWSPWPLELMGSVPGTYDDEQFLHKCFASSHSHREWFRSSPSLRKIIAEILEAGSIAPARASLTPTGNIRKGRSSSTWTKERRRYASYNQRILNAVRKMSRVEGAERIFYDAPNSVSSILERWLGNSYRGIASTPPSQDEIALLDAFLADPASQATEHRIALIRPKTEAVA